MKKTIFTSILLIVCSYIHAQQTESRLPEFDRLTTEDGLYSNNILHILELADGRMAITNDSCVNIYDGEKVRQHHVSSPEIHTLSNYKGHYHVYADDHGQLWVKNYGTVWCMSLATGKNIDIRDIEMTDLFVDHSHRLWIVNDSVVDQRIRFEKEWGELQDLDADSANLYLFFSSSKVACYDKQSNELKYVSQPYDTAEAKFYDKTSLVVYGKDHAFYQLRCGKERFIFLRFDPSQTEWRTVFETNTGVFHTLCIPNEQLALISCPQGLWEINLETGEMNLRAEVMTTGGETLKTGFNSVFCDSKGQLWLGTYNEGVLHADQIHASKSKTIYYVISGLVLLIMALALFFLMYARRQQRRERRLMSRLKELYTKEMEHASVENGNITYVGDKDYSEDERQSKAEKRETSENTSAEDSEFIRQAVALVKQNINTPGYSVERLATDLCMERTGLYKKLTAMLDKTPSLFMRSIRLEHAAELLKEGKLSIAEIAEHAGFSSASYFSKQFQEVYGCKPSEYAK